MEIKRVKLETVRPNVEGRAVDKKSVEKLAESMNRLGLLNPITVFPMRYTTLGKSDNEGFGIIAGGHRYAAAQMLGWDEIDAFVIESDDARHHRLIEISENLHRAELTVQERAKLVSEWATMVKAQPAQLGPARPQHERGGINDAARQLGLERKEVQRAVKIASLSPEAHATATELKLDDNQSALLDAAKHTEPKGQVEALKKRAGKKAKVMDASATTDKIITLLKSIRKERHALTEVLAVIQSMLKE